MSDALTLPGRSREQDLDKLFARVLEDLDLSVPPARDARKWLGLPKHGEQTVTYLTGLLEELPGHIRAKWARISALERELERHTWTCTSCLKEGRHEPVECLTAEEDQESNRDILEEERKLDEILAAACEPGRTPKSRGELLLAGWRNWLGFGGPPIGARMEMADHVRKVIEAAVVDALRKGQGRP